MKSALGAAFALLPGPALFIVAYVLLLRDLQLMTCIRIRSVLFVVLCLRLFSSSSVLVKAQSPAEAKPDTDLQQRRAKWFSQGREAPRGESAAELRRNAMASKMSMRAARAVSRSTQRLPAPDAGVWFPLGPVPLASDATGSGLQDYHQVSGRATAVAIDPADPTGNTVSCGGGSSEINKGNQGTNPGVYAITVTGSPGSGSQPSGSATVLTVE